MIKKKDDEIVKLNDYQHARLRTEMYLGSRSPHTQTIVNWDGKKLTPVEMTWTPAAYCAFREILDNALDEVVGHGHGSKVDVAYDVKTQEFTVADDGRGIPIDWDENERMHKATIALTCDDQQITGRSTAGGRTVDRNNARTALTADGIGREALAIVDVPDVDLLVFADIGRIEEVFVDGARALIVQFRMRGGHAVQLRLEHGSLHGFLTLIGKMKRIVSRQFVPVNHFF